MFTYTAACISCGFYSIDKILGMYRILLFYMDAFPIWISHHWVGKAHKMNQFRCFSLRHESWQTCPPCSSMKAKESFPDDISKSISKSDLRISAFSGHQFCFKSNGLKIFCSWQVAITYRSMRERKNVSMEIWRSGKSLWWLFLKLFACAICCGHELFAYKSCFKYASYWYL